MLLERDREIADLDRLLQTATEGTAAVCVLEGPAGIGKTRLLAEARSRAADRGMSVRMARASELEGGYGFGVVHQLLEPAVRDDPDGLLSGAAAPARALLVDGTGTDDGAAGPDPSFAVLNGLYWVTARLAEQRPLLLAVDDLQWCDAASLRFLAYLRSRLEGLPVLVVATVRDAEAGADAATLDAFLADPATVRIRPRALSPAGATALIEHRLGSPEPAFAAACHRATGGNPLLLEELIKALESERVPPDAASTAAISDIGPAAIRRSVFVRLGRLGPDAAAVARAVAVLGDGADLALVADLAGLDIGPAGAAVAALARAEVLRGTPPLGFVHPLVADAVYGDVLPGEVGLLHLRAAELQSAAGAPAERVAGHLLHAPPRQDQWAADQLCLAAAEATRKGAAASAASYLQRALAEPHPPERRADLLLQLGRAQRNGDGPRAAESLRAAYDLLTDPPRRAAAAVLLCRTLIVSGRRDQATLIAREAASALGPEHDDLRARLAADEASVAWLDARGPAALDHLSQYRSTPLDGGLGAKLLAAMAVLAWTYACGPSDAVAQRALAVLADGELIREDPNWAAMFALSSLVFADRDEADEWWEVARAAAHRHGGLTQITGITVWHGRALHRRGELADAQRTLRDYQEGLREWGLSGNIPDPFGDVLRAGVLRDKGDIAGARAALGAGPDPDRRDEVARQWLGSHLEQLLAEGDLEATAATADAYADQYDEVARNPMDVPWRSFKALALDQLGRRSEAVELAAAELELARQWGAAGTVARSLRTLGTVVGPPDGMPYLEEAVAVTAGTPARLEHARALTDLGAALRRSRRPADARPPLRQALELATLCGADGLAAHARSELYAAGGRPRRTALTGVGSLTASERRVVDLAAAGATNREIGEGLFIAPTTVAMHLSNAYRKLGVTSRHDLAAALRVDPT